MRVREGHCVEGVAPLSHSHSAVAVEELSRQLVDVCSLRERETKRRGWTHFLTTDKDRLNSTPAISFPRPRPSALISYVQSISEDADPLQPGEPAQHAIEINEKTTKDLKMGGRKGTVQPCKYIVEPQECMQYYDLGRVYSARVSASHHHEDEGQGDEDVGHGKGRHTCWDEEGQADSSQADQRHGQGETQERCEGRLQPWKSDGYVNKKDRNLM